LHGCVREGFPFKGVLFIGLMMTADGPKVLEYNVRFGDPETQAILVRLGSDLVDVCDAIVKQELDPSAINWHPGSSACVVLAAEGYPGNAHLGDVIQGLEKVNDARVFHAGTSRDHEGRFITSGGRVLGVTALGEDLEAALSSAYAAVDKISWPGMQYRKDIGK
jgi:phosphoribosylamine--glycine ligase